MPMVGGALVASERSRGARQRRTTAGSVVLDDESLLRRRGTVFCRKPQTFVSNEMS